MRRPFRTFEHTGRATTSTFGSLEKACISAERLARTQGHAEAVVVWDGRTFVDVARVAADGTRTIYQDALDNVLVKFNARWAA